MVQLLNPAKLKSVNYKPNGRGTVFTSGPFAEKMWEPSTLTSASDGLKEEKSESILDTSRKVSPHLADGVLLTMTVPRTYGVNTSSGRDVR